MSQEIESIAVVGMACRFPGANNPDAFWDNVAGAVESIGDLDEALLSDVDAALLAHPRYVRRGAQLEGVELFDAAFFGLTAREASLMSPAQRLLLVCAHEALEDACFKASEVGAGTGVFVGTNRCDDWQKRLYAYCDAEGDKFATQLQAQMANDADYGATKVSYHLNLRGPSVNVSSACSTSLVAVHQACRSLLSYECDVALAGGASVALSLGRGYVHEAGGMQSSDGRCRAFDAQADGTVFSSGAGIVVLKRLSDAVADRDTIYAVIKGSAVNNDGATKVGYTAPSVSGQAEAISAALNIAGVSPEDISYVEAHGTGTRLGDPIEIQALTRAYRDATARSSYCAIGSVKTNIGHTGVAAGVAGFIKTVQALRHGLIPPSLHFNRANPEIDFGSTPFFVNAQLRTWDAAPGKPRRAGVSSFGVGGTNAHVVLEEAAPAALGSTGRAQQLFVLSARTQAALSAAGRNAAARLATMPEANLADVAYSLNTGREAMGVRRAFVASTRAEALAKLRQTAGHALDAKQGRPVIGFVIPAEGWLQVNTGVDLYRHERVFRDTVDHCCELLRPHLGRDLRSVLYPSSDETQAAHDAMSQARFAQPASFVAAYALARVWMEYGVSPSATTGVGVGDCVAACLAGAVSLPEALRLSALRGAMMSGNSARAECLDAIRSVEFKPPAIAWVSEAAAEGPAYWMNEPAHETDGAARLRDAGCTLVFELKGADARALLEALGDAWARGASIDWRQFYRGEARSRLPMPAYPFEGQHCWLERSNNAKPPAATVRDADAPATALHVLVRDKATALLGIEPPDEHVPLIELGVTSLMAIELTADINDALGAEVLALSDVLGHEGSIAGLAARLSKASSAPADTGGEMQAEAVVAEPAATFEPFALTDIQLAYWMGRQGVAGQRKEASYSYAEADLDGLDPVRLEQALNQLIRRHAALRLVVRDPGVQEVLREVPAYRIACDDFSNDIGRQAKLESVRATMACQILPASTWPLFDMRLSKTSAHTYRLHFGFDLLVFDALSLRVFLRDLFLLYVGKSEQLPVLDYSFRDFVLAKTELNSTPQYLKAERYWLDRLDSLPGAPQLPYVQEPAAQQAASRTGHREFRLDGDTWDRLKDHAKRKHVTPSALLVTAFSEVLAQWCSSPRFTLNLTVLSRPPIHPRINDVVGNFTSSMPLEVDMSGQRSFEDSASAVQRQLMRDVEHRQYSGVEILRALNRRQGGYQARSMPIVFTSVLGLEAKECDLSGVPAGDRQLYAQLAGAGFAFSHTAQVWLDHTVREEHGALVCSWDAQEAMFPGQLLDDMFCAYYDRVMQLANEGERAWTSVRPTRLPVYQQRQRDLVNRTDEPVCEETLQVLFERVAERQPDSPAVIGTDARLSYRDLQTMAKQLGADLRERGACPNELVAVVMEKGWEQVAAVLGVLYSGAAYLPVDPTLPAKRVQDLLRIGEVRFALTQGHLAQAPWWPRDVQVAVVDVETLESNRRTGAAPLPMPVRQQAQDLAYVLFTSGSTGVPKGVMVDHRSVVNTVLDINRKFDVTSQDSVLALNALNFDLSVYDIFGLLAAGGAIVMPDRQRLHDAAHWAQRVVAEKVSLWNTVPALARLYVDELERQPASAAAGDNGIRCMLMSGDWIPTTLPDRIRRVLPQARPISLGGPTETTVWSIWYPIAEVNPQWRSIPYGKPLAHRRHYVLHPDLTPCPDWVPGEIFSAGNTGLSLGYWRDEQRSAQSFVSHPDTGERLYRTGDLGRFLPDGNVEMLGRIDTQAKLNGYRVELEEIEFFLRQCDGVREAVVVPVQAQTGPQLVGYVTSDDALSQAREEAWKASLRASLPYYMVPNTIVRLDAFPLSQNGKVDRAALSAMPASQRANADKSPVAARDDVEAAILDIWRKALDNKDLGVEDNLFVAGGDSLAATMLVTEVARVFGVNIPLASVFAQPTVAGMAADCRRLLRMEPTRTGHDNHPRLSIADLLKQHKDISALLAQEAQLSPQIQPAGTVPPETESPRCVLLTGATGFLGAYLLKELLNRTAARIYCLARPGKGLDAGQKLKLNLQRHGLWHDDLAGRVIAVSGDLRKERLGVDDATYSRLADEVDVIFHAGAEVSYARAYADVRGSNVDGTLSVIRLACAGKLKALNFVSTEALCRGMNERGIVLHRDEGPILNLVGDVYGYTQSKWVGERLVDQAGQRGVPVAIFRPGFVAGQAARGAYQPDDVFHRLMRLLMAVNSVPCLDDWSDGAVEIASVDYVAAAIVAIGSKPSSYGKYFHLRNPEPVAIADLFRLLKGDSAPVLPYGRWVDECLAAIASSADPAMGGVLRTLFAETARGHVLREVAVNTTVFNNNAKQALRDTGVRCLPAEELLREYCLPALRQPKGL